MRRVFAFLFALAFLGVTAPALADVPTEMSVQGRLTNAGGSPVPAGLKNFTFKIFDLQVGGVEIWPGGPGETQVLTTDANGLWNAGVGTVIPLTEAVFQSPVRWLEVTVDDGVNPIETLPRIELRTNPYTYRAATSQQADSLGGSSLTDLTDQFVDVPGDVMTGSLGFSNGTYPMTYVYQSGTSNAERSVVTHSPGFPTYGLFYQDIGDSWHFKVNGTNVVSVAGNGDFRVEGGGSPTIITAQLSGDNSVQIPNDAVSALEMLDEPGLAAANDPTLADVALTGVTTDFETVTITTPASGYIRVVGNVYSWITGGAGDAALAFFQIDETSGGGPTIPYYRLVGVANKPNATNSFHPVTVERIYLKAAGTYTFRLEGAEISVSGTGGVWTIWPMLTATYFPTAYGTVSTVISSSEAGEFQQAERVETGSATAGLDHMAVPSQVTYQADLRELELRAARAEAEAARAREAFERAAASNLSQAGPGALTAPEENKP